MEENKSKGGHLDLGKTFKAWNEASFEITSMVNSGWYIPMRLNRAIIHNISYHKNIKGERESEHNG